jgi:hypothetical protein
MPRDLTVPPHLSVDELEARYRAGRDPVERSRWHMVWLAGRAHPLCGEVGPNQHRTRHRRRPWLCPPSAPSLCDAGSVAPAMVRVGWRHGARRPTRFFGLLGPRGDGSTVPWWSTTTSTRYKGGCGGSRGGTNRASRRDGDGLGRGRAPHRRAAGAASGLGAARPAPDRPGAAALPVALRLWLRVSEHRAARVVVSCRR